MKYNFSFNSVFSSMNIKNRDPLGRSLNKHIDIARSSVDDITTTIQRIYDRPDADCFKKAQVHKKEKDLMGTLGNAEKKRFILKKKLFYALSPLEDEERLVDDLIKLSNLRSLSELLNLNQGNKKKKDILKLFRLRRMKKEEDAAANVANNTAVEVNCVDNSNLTNNIMNKTTNPSRSPSFRKKIDKSEFFKLSVTSNKIFLSPVKIRGSKYLEKIKPNNPTPIHVNSNTSLHITRLSMKLNPPKFKTIDVEAVKRRRHLSTIF
jgi:hypothetical protein